MKYTYFNRDLSWLRFNERVLQEAEDTRNPIYERIKFLAIYSSNLDEFFKVRVSDIRQIKTLDKELRKKLITKPNRLLKEIKKEVDRQGEHLGDVFRNQILPELEELGVKLLKYEELSFDHKRSAIQYVEEELENVLPIKTDFTTEEDALFIKNEQLYLVSSGSKEGIICVEIPNNKRFLQLRSDHPNEIIYIDDVIRVYLNDKFETEFYALKVSRDAELYIEDEYSGNLLEKIKDSLSNRKVGQITRALIDKEVDELTLNRLNEILEINDTDLIHGGRYHNLKDLFGFPNPIGNELENKALPPITPSFLEKGDSIFSIIQQKERILHFPYESYNGIVKGIIEASVDPLVKTIKITLYRVSSDSKIAQALVNAVKNGKEVFVFIETKARFDEENNIKWGKELERVGANVRYSYPGIKVHSKILYIERGEEERYAYIGTGNFNEKTANIYTDFGLLTADSTLTNEVNQVFRVLEGELIVPKIKHLLVSPFTSRDRFTTLVEKEIKKVKSGGEGRIFMKLNSIEDSKMIKLLYKASNAGVKIKLIVRGICCLIPGVKDQSENIEIVSIIDRYLEHARVYIFGSDENEKMYIGSADWMTRNIDHRIEVITPIHNHENFKMIKDVMNIQWEDNIKGRMIDENQVNSYLSRGNNIKSSQERIYGYLLEKNNMASLSI